MCLYYFLLKRYEHNYQQVKCVISYLAILLPIMAVTSIIRHSFPLVFHALLFLTGWCTWTFIEYILHRFWMHDKNASSAMTETHLYHHSHPTERVIRNYHRVLMVVVVAVLVVIAHYLDDYFTFFVGFCFGTEAYFVMHEVIHSRFGQRTFKKLVRYHIYHHCKYPNTCYGVSVPWWDDVFKSVPAAPKLTERVIEFYFNGNTKEDQQSLRNAASEAKVQLVKTKNCNRDCNTCVLVSGTEIGRK